MHSTSPSSGSFPIKFKSITSSRARKKLDFPFVTHLLWTAEMQPSKWEKIENGWVRNVKYVKTHTLVHTHAQSQYQTRNWMKWNRIVLWVLCSSGFIFSVFELHTNNKVCVSLEREQRIIAYAVTQWRCVLSNINLSVFFLSPVFYYNNIPTSMLFWKSCRKKKFPQSFSIA